MPNKLPNHRRSIEEVAAILRVRESYVTKVIGAGELKASKGLVFDNDLRAFLDSKLTSPAGSQPFR